MFLVLTLMGMFLVSAVTYEYSVTPKAEFIPTTSTSNSGEYYKLKVKCDNGTELENEFYERTGVDENELNQIVLSICGEAGAEELELENETESKGFWACSSKLNECDWDTGDKLKKKECEFDGWTWDKESCAEAQSIEL